MSKWIAGSSNSGVFAYRFFFVLTGCQSKPFFIDLPEARKKCCFHRAPILIVFCCTWVKLARSVTFTVLPLPAGEKLFTISPPIFLRNNSIYLNKISFPYKFTASQPTGNNFRNSSLFCCCCCSVNILCARRWAEKKGTYSISCHFARWHIESISFKSKNLANRAFEVGTDGTVFSTGSAVRSCPATGQTADAVRNERWALC